MSRQRRGALAVLVLCLLLIGCGQKGPLYREAPEDDEQARQAESRQIPTHLTG